MREIKFRGRRKNSTEWAYGAFLAIPRLCSYIYDVQPDGQATRYLVDEDTVGQFTGLLDSNGKEIYEGDIVRFELPPMVLTNEKTAVGVVVYEYGQFLVIIHAMRFTIFSIINDCTVIGNVHDNPDLLKVAHD